MVREAGSERRVVWGLQFTVYGLWFAKREAKSFYDSRLAMKCAISALLHGCRAAVIEPVEMSRDVDIERSRDDPPPYLTIIKFLRKITFNKNPLFTIGIQ